MKIKSYKCYNTKAEIEEDLKSLIQNQLENMNNCLKYLIEFKAEAEKDYVKNLIKRLQDEIKTIENEEGYFDFAIKVKFEFLDKYPELRKITMKYLLSHLNPMKKSPKDAKKYIIFGLNRAKAGERISYHRVKTLTEMFGKEEGLELYTKILTRIVQDMHKKNPPNPERTVAISDERSIKWWCEIGIGNFTSCLFDENKALYRFDKCFTHEALKDFNDPDVAYYASCYIGDIPVFNEGRIIKMRRTQTLHHRDFCDELYWDSRHYDNPEQPSLDFTRKMGREED